MYSIQFNFDTLIIGHRRTYNRLKKSRNIPIYLNTNYRREMKLISMNMDYSLFQFDALKFILGVRLHGGSMPNFNFF